MGCIIKIGNKSVSETDFLNHLNKIININKLFEENIDFSSQIYEALGFESNKNKLLADLKTRPLHEALNITNVSNAKELVDALIKFRTKAGFEKILNLFDKNELKNIKIIIGGKDTASYRSATNTLSIHPEYFKRAEIGDFYTTIIHELVHHKFRGADIASGLNILYGITNIKNTIKQLPVHNKYRELYVLVRNSTDKTKNDYYGLSSVDEFISEGYSNPKFQAFLKTVVVGNKSAMDKLVDLILAILTLNIQRVFNNKFNSNNAFDIFRNIDIQSNNILQDFNNNIQNYQQITPQQKQEAQLAYSQYLEQGGSQTDIKGFKEFVENKTPASIKLGVPELFESNPKLANAVYEALGLNTINESEITWTDEQGNPCAKMGLTNAIKGTDWKIVKDFKGKPKHSQGGVDITISNDGVTMRRGGKDIKAKYGLLIINNN